MTLHFKEGDQPLYGLSFSFVPGDLFCGSRSSAILIGRMQGRVGEAARIARATRACGAITPQAALYCALSGLASASGFDRIVGVAGENHVCYSDRLSEDFHRAYDTFYTTHHARRRPDGFFELPLSNVERDLSLVARSHRRRTRKKRAAKQIIAEVAHCAWRGLLRAETLVEPSRACEARRA